ncbi:MAG: hypothetical protein ACI8Q1_000510 [Parvicella sp.]|jgi:hypothetical protein
MKKIYFGFLTLIMGVSVTAQTAPQTSICVVTVDTSSSFNLVIWERADQISSAGIDSMYIYRKDDATNIYEFIDAVDYDDLSQYEDMDTVADPNLKSSSYRIAGKDINGQLGAMSDSARTIFLEYVYSGGTFTLSWNPYVGASFTDYICWDKEPVQAVNLLQGTMTTWAFTAIVPGQQYGFMIDLTDMSGCTSTKANHNTSRSNKTTGGVAAPVGVEENSIVGLKLFPNPVTNELNINFSSRKSSASTIKIYNLLGEVVYAMPSVKYYGPQSLKLDVSRLTAGLYLISIENGSSNQTIKFSK